MSEVMVRKGTSKLTRKLERMKSNYEKARTIAVDNYKACGFVADVTTEYERAWSDMPANYRAAMTPEKVSKWAKNWSQKMFGRVITA